VYDRRPPRAASEACALVPCATLCVKHTVTQVCLLAVADVDVSRRPAAPLCQFDRYQEWRAGNDGMGNRSLLAAEGPRRGLARAHRSLAGALVTGHVRAVPASAPLHSCVSFDKFQEWRPERDRNDGIGIGIDNRSLRAAEGTLGDTLPGGLPMYEQARPRRAGVGDRYTTRLRKTTEPSSS
jgi:hypothetical protein